MTRGENPAPTGDPAREPVPAADAGDEESLLASRLAALDDCLSGRASIDGLSRSLDDGLDDDADNFAISETLDAILLLRQVAAADREKEGQPILMPATVGRFEVVREVGRGGFAFVVEAFDPKLCRRVALKVARPEAVLSGEIRRRFIREAELAARLVHPHIVTIHEVGESEGLAFIAQEFCAGGSLAEWLADHPGPVEPAVATRLVRSLAEAVASAHAAGILHRDIKPGNVLLVPAATGAAAILPATGDGPGWTVKLGDFGLGKLFTESSADVATQLTRSGSRVGTPAWMAPEQIDRSFGTVGPATDVHALGVLLERLLTGRSAHEGDGEAETFRRILLQEPIPITRLNRRVSADLAAVCLKCLAKRPADRYSTAAELAADLSRHLEGRPTRARPLSAGGRLSRAIFRRPVVFGLAAAAVGSTLLAGLAMRQTGRETAMRNAAASMVRQRDAAAELQRGFEAWRVGNVAAAATHLRSCGSIDDELGRSYAARWLLRRLHGEREILLEPADPRKDRIDLYVVAVAANGAAFAAGSADGTLAIVVPARAGMPAQPPRTIAAHDEINDVAFSPDASEVATAGQDGRLRVWRVADGASVRELPRSDGPLFAVAFSPDGEWIAYGGGDRVLRIVPAAGPAGMRELRPFEGLSEAARTKDPEIESIQFCGDDVVAVACGDKVAILDIAAGKTRHLLGEHGGVVGQLAVSRDGRYLLSAGTDREPQVWEVVTGKRLMSLPVHPSWVQGCDFSPDGASIATGCRDGVIRVFDAESGRLRTRLFGHVGRTWDVRYAPDGSIVSAGADGTLRRWNPHSLPESVGLVDVSTSAAERDGGSRASGDLVVSTTEVTSGPPHARVVEFADGQQAVLCDAVPRASEPPPPRALSLYEVAADWAGDRFALRQFNWQIVVHRLPGVDVSPDEAPWSSPPARPLPARGVAWTPSGLLLMSHTPGSLVAWDGVRGESHELDRFGEEVTAMAVLPGGRPRLAVAAWRVVKAYDLPASGSPLVSAGRILVALEKTADPIMELAWSPDGGRLAYGTTRGVVKVIDAHTGAAIFDLAAMGHEITGIIWSADGRTLITADTESVRISDARTTTTYDEFRPDWRIEKLSRSFGGPAGAEPFVVLTGQTISAGDANGVRFRAAVLGCDGPSAEPHP